MSPNAYIERRIEKVPVVTTVIEERPVFDINGLTQGEMNMLLDGLSERKDVLRKIGLVQSVTAFEVLIGKISGLFNEALFDK